MTRLLVLIGLVAAALLAPYLIYPDFLTQALCFALFASAFNLLFGHGGLLSFGHAAFFGTGAYVAAYLMIAVAPSPLAALVLGALAAGALGAVFGALAVRRSGVYLAMITLSLAEIVYFVVLHMPVTGGEDGLQGVPRGALLGLIDLENARAMYFFALAVYVLAMVLLYRIVHSPYGAILAAIKENEPRAISLGYRVERYKVLAFALSASLSGLAGALKALALHFAALDDVYWHTSGEVILMTLLGGLGTVIGPSVGAAIVVALTDSLAAAGEWVNFLLGAVFVLCVLLFRRGVVGEILAWAPRLAASSGRASQSGRGGEARG
jgi:branched-chain amino acid transport system permease protein